MKRKQKINKQNIKKNDRNEKKKMSYRQIGRRTKNTRKWIEDSAKRIKIR